MSLSEQEQRELAHLRAFRASVSDFPAGNIPAEGEESQPDFRVFSAQRVVGIEHTEIYHKGGGRGIPLQARETYMEQITRRAQKIYESRENPPVSVWPSFSTNARLGSSNVDSLAEQLADIVEDNLPPKGESADLKQSWSAADRLPRQFYAVRILRYGGPDAQFWFPPMSGFEPELPVSLVKERIEAKNAKRSDYRSRCDAVWLLIVVDGSRPSTFFDVSGQALRETYDSSFDRTYLFDFQKREAHQLATTGDSHNR
jgi:hypothetical protein